MTSPKEPNELTKLVQDSLDPNYYKRLMETLKILDEVTGVDTIENYRIIEKDHTQCRPEMTYIPR